MLAGLRLCLTQWTSQHADDNYEYDIQFILKCYASSFQALNCELSYRYNNYVQAKETSRSGGVQQPMERKT